MRQFGVYEKPRCSHSAPNLVAKACVRSLDVFITVCILHIYPKNPRPKINCKREWAREKPNPILNPANTSHTHETFQLSKRYY